LAKRLAEAARPPTLAIRLVNTARLMSHQIVAEAAATLSVTMAKAAASVWRPERWA
jgi:hypothetical protein